MAVTKEQKLCTKIAKRDEGFKKNMPVGQIRKVVRIMKEIAAETNYETTQQGIKNPIGGDEVSDIIFGYKAKNVNKKRRKTK